MKVLYIFLNEIHSNFQESMAGPKSPALPLACQLKSISKYQRNTTQISAGDRIYALYKTHRLRSILTFWKCCNVDCSSQICGLFSHFDFCSTVKPDLPLKRKILKKP